RSILGGVARLTAKLRWAPFRQLAMWLAGFEPAYGVGSVIEVRGGASAQLRYTNDATAIRLKEGTTLKLLAARPGQRVEVLSGIAQIDATPQPMKQPLEIITPLANVRVVGTKFILMATERSTRVSVSEGQVKLVARTTTEDLAIDAGERAVAQEKSTVIRQTL